MSTFVSLVRGINVAGRKKVRMEDLAALYKSMNFTRVRTYLQSGNVLFDTSEKDPKKLPAFVEKEIEKKFGFGTRVIIRTTDELLHIVTNNPFLKKDDVDASKLHVTFLSDTPPEPSRDGRIQTKDHIDYYSVIGCEIYLFCPNGYGRTLLSNSFFEKEFGVNTTTRNWRTINKLLELAQVRKRP